MKKWLPILILAIIPACSSGKAGDDKSSAAQPASTPAALLSQPISASASGDPAPADDPNATIHLVVYKMIIPLGTASDDPAFWKLIDEDSVDVATYNSLYKNGIRVGHGKTADWGKFRVIIDKSSTVCTPVEWIFPPGNAGLPMVMTPELPNQMLFVLDEHGANGRTYDVCQNQFVCSFLWEPHKKQTIRATVCPEVLAKRTRFDYMMSDDPAEKSYIQQEQLYDIRLHADIAPGEFLVIAPSPEAKTPETVGHQFLTLDGPADRFEQILIFVADPMPLEKISPDAAATRPAAAPRVVH